MPSAPRLHDRSCPCSAPDTARDFACHTLRDNLAITNERLDRMAPDALDIAAESISLLGDALRGHASRLCGQREPDYRRGQLIGRNPITVPDLAWLAGEAPEAVRAALIPLAAAAGYTLQPMEPRGGRDLLLEQAQMVATAALLGLSIVEAESDGVRTEEERLAVLAGCQQTKQELADIEAIALDPEAWRGEVARRVGIHQATKSANGEPRG